MAYRYVQTVIGTCGHVCEEWPQVAPLGGKSEVICDTCTREKYGVGAGETMTVWVRVEDKPKAKRQPSKKRATTPKKSRALNQADFWGVFLDGSTE